MSIASRISAMQEHLTDDYSVLELAGADLTNVDKNIFNLKQTWEERLLYFLKNGTDVVWNNWEKVSGSGTQISLSNTEEAPMRLVYKGNTQQNGTPTPDTPIPVQVVSGDNIIKVEGKDLFDKSKATSGYRLDSLGNLFVDATYFASDFIEVKPYIQYITNIQPTVYKRICEYDDNKTFITSKDNPNTNTITTSSATHYIRVSGLLTELDTTMVCEGASYHISLSSSNMFDKTQSSYGYRLDTTGKNYSETGYFITPFIKVEPSTQYTKNSPTADAFHRVAFYTTNNQNFFISVDSSNNTFTTPSTCKYLRFCGIVSEISTTQLNEGNAVLPYQSYFTPIELCKIGTYQDKIFINKLNTTDYNSNLKDNTWYLKKEIGKVVLNGSESWYARIGTKYNCQITNNLPSNKGTGTDFTGYSNYYIAGGNWDYSGDKTILVYKNSAWNYANIQITDSSFATAQELQNWLNTHNTELYYPLANPTYEEITDATLINQLEAIKSLNEQTNISQENNDLPFELDVVALKEV